MTLRIIEGVLLMGMVGLIWVMLDIFAGDRNANDKQDNASGTVAIPLARKVLHRKGREPIVR